MAQSGSLEGMSALITGGGGGIGSASAKWLLQDGCSVTIMGRTESTLLDAQKWLQDSPQQLTYIRCRSGIASRCRMFPQVRA